MKYWQIWYQNKAGKDITRIMSDDEVIAEYWDYWYSKMISKFGKDHVDNNYSKLECIEDWAVTNWAVEIMEVKDE
jgi:hypothetical protein